MRIEKGSLVVLIGAPGSGKSSLVARIFSTDEEVLATDWFRQKLTGDAANFGMAEEQINDLIRGMGETRLRSGLTTVVDSTGPAWVVEWAKVMRERHGVRVYGVALDIDPAICRERNRARHRTVSDEAMDGLMRRVKADLNEYRRSGVFDDLAIITTDDQMRDFELQIGPFSRG